MDRYDLSKGARREPGSEEADDENSDSTSNSMWGRQLVLHVQVQDAVLGSETDTHHYNYAAKYIL
jgi:hypothetical protein